MSESIEYLTNVLRDVRDLSDSDMRKTPAAIFQPKLSVDGNQFCFLLGDDLQSGIAGFGNTPYLAALDFDKNFYQFDMSKSPAQGCTK